MSESVEYLEVLGAGFSLFPGFHDIDSRVGEIITARDGCLIFSINSRDVKGWRMSSKG